MTIISREQFENEVRERAKNDKTVLELLDGIDECNTFDEIHACDFTHGQYSATARSDCLDAYLADFYPNCEYEYRWVGMSLVLARIKTPTPQEPKKAEPDSIKIGHTYSHCECCSKEIDVTDNPDKKLCEECEAAWKGKWKTIEPATSGEQP